MVNESWRRFAMENSAEPGKAARGTEPGTNYLDVCRAASGSGSEGASDAHDGILAVLERRLPGFTLRYPCHAPDGQRWFAMSVTPLHGVAHGVVIGHTDVSARKQGEDELRQSEMRWQFALESNGDAMWDWDAEKDQLSLTPAARELFDLPQVQSRLSIYDLLGRISNEDRVSMQFQIEDIARCRATEWSSEVRLSRPGMPVRWIATRGRVMTRTAEGKPHRVVSISSDITLRKQSQTEARRQRELVAHQGRLVLLGELASTLAHEINQPLTAISGFAAGCMRKTTELPEVQELVRSIEEQAVRAGEIAWRMRGFARRQRFGRSALSLHEVVGSVAKWMRLDNTHSEITIDFRGVSEDLPRVYADRVELEQVLVNLIRNGIEAGQRNPSERRVAVFGFPGDHADELQISVKDWGHGLPNVPDFEAFRAFSTSKDDGLGLGLSICRSIVEGHGGRLWAGPNPEGGAIFHFTLPMAVEGATERGRGYPDA
jgi:two-component system sensor kinase FixL